MKVRLTLESRNQSGAKVEAARALIDDAIRRALVAGPEQQAALRHWIAGASAVWSMVSGEEPPALPDALVARAAAQPAAQPVMNVPPGMPQIVEGRSTPPPPRAPGAQRPVSDAAG